MALKQGTERNHRKCQLYEQECLSEETNFCIKTLGKEAGVQGSCTDLPSLCKALVSMITEQGEGKEKGSHKRETDRERARGRGAGSTLDLEK